MESTAYKYHLMEHGEFLNVKIRVSGFNELVGTKAPHNQPEEPPHVRLASSTLVRSLGQQVEVPEGSQRGSV